MPNWKKIKSFWKKFRKSVLFLFFFAVAYSVTAKIIEQYLFSERGAEMIKQYLASFSVYYSYFTSAVMFFLILGGFYLGYLLAKSRNKALREDELDNQKNSLEEIHQKDIQSLSEPHQAEITGLKKENKEKFEELETDYKNKLQEADEFKKGAEKKLEDISWLINYAKKQEQNIADSVEIDKVIYSRSDLEGHPFYYVVFALNVFNKSVFPITFDETMSGKLIYHYEPLKLTPTFDEPPPVIQPLGINCIRIKQELTKEEAESFSRVMDRYEAECIERNQQTVGGYPNPAKIQFKDLIFTIKSPDKSDDKSNDNFPKVNASQKSVLLEFEVTKRNFNFSTRARKAWGAIQPLITPIETTPVDFQFGDNGKMIKGGKSERNGWGLFVKFFSVPTDYSDIPINVKAIITFTNLETGKTARVNDGVWYDEDSNYKEFQTGDAGELIIGFYDDRRNKQLARYEYKGKKTGFNAEGFFIAGENFEIDVELLGKHNRKHVFQDHFKFKFEVVNDSFKFEDITNKKPEEILSADTEQKSDAIQELENDSQISETNKPEIDILFKNLNIHQNPYVSNRIIHNKDLFGDFRVLRVQIKNDNNEIIEKVKLKLENVVAEQIGETPFSFTTNLNYETKLDELSLSDIEQTFADFALQSKDDKQKVVLCVFSQIQEMRDIFGLEFDIVLTSKGLPVCSKRFTLYLDDSNYLQLKEKA